MEDTSFDRHVKLSATMFDEARLVCSESNSWMTKGDKSAKQSSDTPTAEIWEL